MFRHNRLASNKGCLTETLTHVDSSVGLHRRHEGVNLTVARITSNLAEVAILTKVHKEGRIANAAIETVLVGQLCYPEGSLSFGSASLPSMQLRSYHQLYKLQLQGARGSITVRSGLDS